MEKSKNNQDISYVLDVRTITSKAKNIQLIATQKQCEELSEYFNLPRVKSLKVDLSIYLNKDCIEMTGSLSSHVIQKCIVTMEEFEEKITQPLKLLFSEDEHLIKLQDKKIDFSIDEEPIELVENGKIFFHDIIKEQFGLALNPFPKKTNEPFVYYEQKPEDLKDNPFSVLKHLTK